MAIWRKGGEQAELAEPIMRLRDMPIPSRRMDRPLGRWKTQKLILEMMQEGPVTTSQVADILHEVLPGMGVCGGLLTSIEIDPFSVILGRMKIPPKNEEVPAISFFGDASSRMSNFMVLGGVAVAGHRIAEFEERIADIRDRGGIRSEFHWKEYRGGAKQKAYEELCRFGFGLINEKKAALHVMAADFRAFDHNRQEGQTRDTSINKLYWQLCLHRLARFYGKERSIHIRLDAGDDCGNICEMRNQLCAAAYRKFSARPNCIRSIEPMGSEKSGLIQLSDVLLGGIASQLNENRTDTNKGKLAEFIRMSSGRHSWSGSTPSSHKFLTVWHYNEWLQVPRSPNSTGLAY